MICATTAAPGRGVVRRTAVLPTAGAGLRQTTVDIGTIGAVAAGATTTTTIAR